MLAHILYTLLHIRLMLLVCHLLCAYVLAGWEYVRDDDPDGAHLSDLLANAMRTQVDEASFFPISHKPPVHPAIRTFNTRTHVCHSEQSTPRPHHSPHMCVKSHTHLHTLARASGALFITRTTFCAGVLLCTRSAIIIVVLMWWRIKRKCNWFASRMRIPQNLYMCGKSSRTHTTHICRRAEIKRVICAQRMHIILYTMRKRDCESGRDREVWLASLCTRWTRPLLLCCDEICICRVYVNMCKHLCTTSETALHVDRQIYIVWHSQI